MKSILFASLIASAAAFAPAGPQHVTATVSLNAAADYKNDIGVVAPLGLWDPLAMCDTSTPEQMDHLRWVEIKHGRIAMLAVVGYLTTAAGIRFPGAEGIPAGFEAITSGQVPDLVWAQFWATVGLMEIVNQDKGELATGDRFGEFPGDFRNGALDFGWDKQSDAWKLNKRRIELNQGRAAQMGILGLMVHEQMGNLNEILYV